MYATFAIAGLSVIFVLMGFVNSSALIETVLFAMLGIGIRRFSLSASIIALLLYIANVGVAVSRGAWRPGVVIPVIVTSLFISAVRAALFMRRQSIPSETSAKPDFTARIWPWMRPILFSVIGLLFTLTAAELAVMHPFVMPSGSMEPTLLIGDHFFVLRPSFMGPIQRGGVVAFRAPYDANQLSTKRVVGIPGDRIHFENNQLFLNGRRIDEPYVKHQDSYPDTFRDNFPSGQPPQPAYESGFQMLRDHVHDGEVIVPRGNYFVLGDNRDNSLDSRYWGFVPSGNVIGRPWLIYDSEDNGKQRQGRSGKLIPRFLIEPDKARIG